MAAGMSIEQIVDEHADLTGEDIRACIALADDPTLDGLEISGRAFQRRFSSLGPASPFNRARRPENRWSVRVFRTAMASAFF